MRAVIFAYNEIGYACIEELIAAKVDVLCLFTHKDQSGEEIWFRPPRLLAEKHRIPVYDPPDPGQPEWLALLRDLAPDYIFSFYYRNLLSREVLDTARKAALNLHGSLLPRFRGRCPVNWVLIEGEGKTGVTLHVMEIKPDAGDIVAQKEVPVAFDDTAHTLFAKMTEAARELMRNVLPDLERGTFTRTPQRGPSSYYGGRKPEDGHIDWHQDAVRIYNLIRAVTHPYPGAYTYWEGRKLFIWQALPEAGSVGGSAGQVVSTRPVLVETGSGLLRLISLQREGEPEEAAENVFARHAATTVILGGLS